MPLFLYLTEPKLYANDVRVLGHRLHFGKENPVALNPRTLGTKPLHLLSPSTPVHQNRTPRPLSAPRIRMSPLNPRQRPNPRPPISHKHPLPIRRIERRLLPPVSPLLRDHRPFLRRDATGSRHFMALSAPKLLGIAWLNSLALTSSKAEVSALMRKARRRMEDSALWGGEEGEVERRCQYARKRYLWPNIPHMAPAECRK